MQEKNKAQELIKEFQKQLNAVDEMLEKLDRLRSKTYNLFYDLIRDELPYTVGDIVRITKIVKFSRNIRKGFNLYEKYIFLTPSGTEEDHAKVLDILINDVTGSVTVSIRSDVDGCNMHGYATVTPDQIALVLKHTEV